MPTLHTPDATVTIAETEAGKRRIDIIPITRSVFVSKRACLTSYPLELIEAILEVKGASHLCDEIARDEDPGYVEQKIERDLFSYCQPDDFAGKRILDFGCGSGASTLILARMFPSSQIVGADMLPEYIRLARLRANFYGLGNLAFYDSESGTELPKSLGNFDVIVMSAVFEHLLPEERRILLPRLWARLNAGGLLVLNQTPYRYYPIEWHTTGLPLLNYLPPFAALRVARLMSKRVSRNESWDSLLRRGIRGGSEREVRRLLGPEGIPLRPRAEGEDRIDIWYRELRPRMRWLKALVRLILKAIHALTGANVLPELAVVFRKGSAD